MIYIRPKNKSVRKSLVSAQSIGDTATGKAAEKNTSPIEIPEAVEIIGLRTSGDWHTPKGVAQMTGLPADTVAAALRERPERFEQAFIGGVPVYRFKKP